MSSAAGSRGPDDFFSDAGDTADSDAFGVADSAAFSAADSAALTDTDSAADSSALTTAAPPHGAFLSRKNALVSLSIGSVRRAVDVRRERNFAPRLEEFQGVARPR